MIPAVYEGNCHCRKNNITRDVYFFCNVAYLHTRMNHITNTIISTAGYRREVTGNSWTVFIDIPYLEESQKLSAIHIYNKCSIPWN